ncbi:hypothetical protein EIP86_008835 [Pleurotus ostreatoroseus]|nr:hypothetical protein EIP86_008835 [Pleurotus ostreatoroseus]
MLRGSFIAPFRSSKSADNPPPPSSGTPPTSSSIFPALSKLETASENAPRSSTQGGPSRAPPPPSLIGIPTLTSSSSSSAKDAARITLKFTGPSFLDVVVKDADTKEALYIFETVHDSTNIYRLDGDSRQAIRTATVKFPPTVMKGRGKTGITVQAGEGRWREAEDFLKCGALGNFAYVLVLDGAHITFPRTVSVALLTRIVYSNRKFNIPHWPNPLRWKLVPGSSYYCTTSGIKGPIAVFDAAVLSAPPRLRVFQTALNGDAERTQVNYRGVPVLLLDYLMLTALLMVTDVQEWLDRPQTENGRVRIPGSSAHVVQKWLAIIHGEPIPDSPPSSPVHTVISDWDARSRMSSGYPHSSYGGSSSSDPMTPITPASSYMRRDEDIPPVPPLPTSLARTRVQTLAAHPYASLSGKGAPPASASASSFSPLTPPPPLTPPMSASSSGSPAPTPAPGTPALRPLPRPPVASGSLRQRPSTSDGHAMSSAAAFARAAAAATTIDRPASPSVLSISSSSTSGSSSRRARLGRSLTVANVPPQQPPPAAALPLPPKLAQELSGSRYNASGASTSAPAPPDDSRRNSNPLPARPPDFYAEAYSTYPDARAQGRDFGADELGYARAQGTDYAREPDLAPRMQAMSLSGTGAGPPPPRRPYTAHGQPPHAHAHVPIVDAGMIAMDDAAGGARQSYAETIYEQPPPAYDAIDFSLPQVPLPQHTRVPR